jgi:iron complex transport system substrate-binding protein
VARIVTIAPGSAEIVWSLGLGDSIVGKDLASIFPNSDSVVTVNPGHELSLETVLSLAPTIVIADTSDENLVKLEKLVELGFPVVVIPEATSLREINPRVMAVGNTLTKQIDAELQNSILRKTKEIRIAFLYLRGNAGVYLLGGKGSGADSMIAALGASDVGTQLGISGFAPLTAESLAKANPDVILVMNKGLESVGGIEKLITLPGISSTKAAQNRSIIQADDRALLSFGPQTPNVISCLANQLNQISTLS